MLLKNINKRKEKRAVALIAAIGILAVLTIIVFAVAFVSQNSYHKSGQQEDEAKLNTLIHSALAKEKYNLKSRPVVNMQCFKYDFNDGSAVVCTIFPSETDGIYSNLMITPEDGDVLLKITANLKDKEDTQITKNVLVNTKGNRAKDLNINILSDTKTQ